jgi:hypothetical protein
MATLSIRWIGIPEFSQNRWPSLIATTGRRAAAVPAAGQLGQGEDALQDAGWGVTAVAFEVELE